MENKIQFRILFLFFGQYKFGTVEILDDSFDLYKIDLDAKLHEHFLLVQWLYTGRA